VSTATPIRPTSNPPSPLVPREWRLRLDPLLLLAALALVACSCVAIKGATADDVPGDPLYYVERQIAYGVIGVALMYVISRLDYSRLRELKYVIYGLLIGSIVLVFGLATATRGSKRWIETPFMNFQPSELGKVLLVLALSGFIVDRLRGAVASMLNIKLLMHASEQGTVEVLEKVRGTSAAVKRMIERIEDAKDDAANRLLSIAHSNAEARAQELANRIMERYAFREVVISDMGAVIGTYAGEGGLLVAY